MREFFISRSFCLDGLSMSREIYPTDPVRRVMYNARRGYGFVTLASTDLATLVLNRLAALPPEDADIAPGFVKYRRRLRRVKTLTREMSDVQSEGAQIVMRSLLFHDISY